jgi:hypothetical protein
VLIDRRTPPDSARSAASAQLGKLMQKRGSTSSGARGGPSSSSDMDIKGIELIGVCCSCTHNNFDRLSLLDGVRSDMEVCARHHDVIVRVSGLGLHLSIYVSIDVEDI